MTPNNTSETVKSGTSLSVGRSKKDFPNSVTIVKNVCRENERYHIAKPGYMIHLENSCSGRKQNQNK